MATKKDLVEAYQFSRRRLVTAFVSGAPGGREVEPPRPGRTIVGGVALAVLMVAGAAIAGIFSPRNPSEWTDVGLVVSKETGAAYVITEQSDEPLLRPVINITSAKLILGPGHEPRVVRQDAIDGQQIGNAVGILGAPADLPSTGRLIDEGWTACTGRERGIKVHLSAESQVAYADGAGVLVQSREDGTFHVIAEAAPAPTGEAPRAHRYQLDPGVGDQADNLLQELGVGARTNAVEVSEQYLALFPEGGDLAFDSFGVGDVNRPARGVTGVPSGAEVGDVVEADGRSYLLTADGASMLDPFARTVWEYTRPGGTQVHTVEEPPGGDQVRSPYAGARWPAQTLRVVNGEFCALLTPREDGTPHVALAEAPGDEASAAGVGAEDVARRVDPGRGAHVLSGSWDVAGVGTPYVIDAKAVAYALDDTAGELLGYGNHDVRVVPEGWLKLFGSGVPLSQDAALREPRQPRPEGS